MSSVGAGDGGGNNEEVAMGIVANGLYVVKFAIHVPFWEEAGTTKTSCSCKMYNFYVYNNLRLVVRLCFARW